jgi:hypothetical protein
MEQTAGIVDERRRTLRRNLVLVASYLAVMALIAISYQ